MATNELDEVVKALLASGKTPQELFAKDGLLDELKKRLAEAALAYFTPCRATVSPQAGPAFHAMSGHRFTHAGHPPLAGPQSSDGA